MVNFLLTSKTVFFLTIFESDFYLSHALSTFLLVRMDIISLEIQIPGCIRKT